MSLFHLIAVTATSALGFSLGLLFTRVRTVASVSNRSYDRIGQ